MGHPVDVFVQRRIKAEADVEVIREKIRLLVIQVAADASDLAEHERARGADTLDVKPISMRLRELDSLLEKLASKRARLSELASTIESIETALGLDRS